MNAFGPPLDEQDRSGNLLRGAKLYLKEMGIEDDMARRMIELVQKEGPVGPNEPEAMKNLRIMIKEAEKLEKNGLQ